MSSYLSYAERPFAMGGRLTAVHPKVNKQTNVSYFMRPALLIGASVTPVPVSVDTTGFSKSELHITPCRASFKGIDQFPGEGQG